MTFKEKLVILRKGKGLTQDEFASAVGVSRQAVYKWECGQSYPEVPKLLEMKLLFSISIDELLDDSFDIPVPEKKKKRISKSTKEKIEASVAKATESSQTHSHIMSEVARVAAESVKPAAPKSASAPKPAAPKATPVAEPASKAAPTPKATPVAEPAPKEEPVKVAAPIVEEASAPAPEAAPAASEKKTGFFGKLFGRK